jgi:hypothetical protein
MQIYTGTIGGSEKKLSEIRRLGLGVCISSEPSKAYKDIPCFLDNGAFEAWRRGFPFSESRFLALIDKAYSCGLSIGFIVCPDIVCGGMDSFDFSMSWVKRLRPARLALAVQDGMDYSILCDSRVTSLFTHIFVGGSFEWKWQTAERWVKEAHERGLKLHIGRCGTLEKIRYADKIGADSIDSTSFARNDSWHIVEEYLRPIQTQIEIKGSANFNINQQPHGGQSVSQPAPNAEDGTSPC